MNILFRITAQATKLPGAFGACTFNNARSIIRPKQIPRIAQFSVSSARYDLMEFFEDKKNWGENEVKHGRAWNKDELRIKSNSDLHKLWFVLLKERNMLLTMEHECDDKMELFPSPERLDKVNESMKNLEDVVRERNRAFFELETGESGERPGKLVSNPLGLRFFYRMFEHVIPKYGNRKWNETHKFHYGGSAVHKFLKFYREKIYNVKRKQRNRDRNEVIHLLKRFPDMDRSVIAAKYPTVDIDKLLKQDKIRGNYLSAKV